MKNRISVVWPLLKELIGRYTVALSVGIVFFLFSILIMSKFMSHLSMVGKMMPYEIGLFMVFEVPLWMLGVKILGIWHRSAWAEIIIAGVIAIAVVQLRTFDTFFWPNFTNPSVDPSSKAEMLFWFVYTVSNYLLATHTAAIYCWLAWIIRKRRTPSAEGAI